MRDEHGEFTTQSEPPDLQQLLRRQLEAEKRRAARIAIINRVGRLITASLNLAQLLQTAVEAISEHLYYHNVALLFVDPADPETLVLRARSGVYTIPEIDNYRQSIHQGVIGAAACARRTLLINDVWQDPRYLPVPGADRIKAELAIPIIVGERLLAVLNIESEHQMNQEDVSGLEIIADQLGVAIENARLFAEIQSSLAQTQLLYETSQRISTAMDVEEVVQAYLEQVAVRGRYACNVVLYELDEAGRRTAVVVRGRWTPQEGLLRLEERLPYTQDVLDPPLDAGQTITIVDVNTDPRVPAGLRQLQVRDNRPALALIPLMVRGQRIGLVVLSYPLAHEWPEADLHPYQATAAQLATAIDSRRQYQLLYDRGRQIAILHERQRLARDLHDSVTQLLFSMTLIAQSISPAWRRDPVEGERRVNRLLELSQSALAEMRALLAELRPLEPSPPRSAPAEGTEKAGLKVVVPGIVQLKQDGLLTVLPKYIADMAGDGLQIELDATAYTRQPFEHEEALYRITQEALNNVVKHARARLATIKLSTDDDSIHLTVVDDGVGFSPAAYPSQARPLTIAAAGNGLGLTTMRERAEVLGGVTSLRAAPGRGTTVAVTIPRKDKRP